MGDDLHTYDNVFTTVTGGIVSEDIEAEDHCTIFIRSGIFTVDGTLDTGFGAFADAMITSTDPSFRLGRKASPRRATPSQRLIQRQLR